MSFACHRCGSTAVEYLPKVLHHAETTPGLGSFYICTECAAFSVRGLEGLEEPTLADWRAVKHNVRMFLVCNFLPRLVSNKLKSR